MITQDQLIEIGYITKLHGLKGEMQATITDTVFDDVARCPYLVCEIDGIFVPFFLSGYRFKSGQTILLSFCDIESQEQAEPFCGRQLYFDRRCFTPDEAEEYDTEVEEEMGYIGYTVIDQNLGPLGEIVDINDQTMNVLFIVERNGEELMIPAADDLVLSIDDDAQTIVMNLPAGLVNLDEAETE